MVRYVKGMEISRKNSRNFLQTNWLPGRSEVWSTLVQVGELSGRRIASLLISDQPAFGKHEPKIERLKNWKKLPQTLHDH